MVRIQKAPDIIQLQYKITDCEKKSEVVSTSLFSFYWVLEDVQLAELCDKRMDVLPEHVTLDVKRLIESLDDRLLILGLRQRVPYGGAGLVDREQSLELRRRLADRHEDRVARDLPLDKLCFELHVCSSFHTRSASARQ